MELIWNSLERFSELKGHRGDILSACGVAEEQDHQHLLGLSGGMRRALLPRDVMNKNNNAKGINPESN